MSAVWPTRSRAMESHGARTEQPKRRLGAERDDDLADLPVIDRVGDLVGRGRGGERQFERQVDTKPARAAALGGRVAVVALELEAAHEHAVGHACGYTP